MRLMNVYFKERKYMGKVVQRGEVITVPDDHAKTMLRKGCWMTEDEGGVVLKNSKTKAQKPAPSFRCPKCNANVEGTNEVTRFRYKCTWCGSQGFIPIEKPKTITKGKNEDKKGGDLDV